ncbi:MAG: TrkA C-terminal domain-containing protein [Paenibacillaceae bacterium]
MSEMSIYQSISLDIAQRIVNGEFHVNNKISGRTLLASQYRVSPETIRKAVGLLKEENIVEVSQGKEIHVLSSENAYEYINKFRYLKSVHSLKQDLELLLKEKKKIDHKFEQVLGDIINFSDRLRNLRPYNPIEVTIQETSHVVGKTIADLQFWQSTGATIIALRRDKSIAISPGPHVILRSNDVLVVVGDEQMYHRINEFMNQTLES